MKKILFFFIVSYFITPQILIAQNNDNNWIVYPSGDLGFSRIRDINILDDGEVWIGTYNNGVFKYHLNTWAQFNTTNSGLSDDDVREVQKDSSGRLWMTTWQGISVFDPSDNSWEQLNISSTSLDILYSIEIDDEDRIWIGTGGGAGVEDGLYLWDDSTHYNSNNSELGSNWVIALEKDNNGDIWACTKSIVKIIDTTMTGYPVTSFGMPATSGATDISFTSNNNVWATVYDGGLAYFDGIQWTIFTSSNSPLPEDKLWSITVDLNDNVWIGTENEGLVKFDGVNWTIFNTNNSPLTQNRISSLACDAAGNIWIGPVSSNSGGLVIYNEDGFSSLSGKIFHDKNVDSIYQTTENGISNSIVELSPGGYFGITDSEGNYNINILDSGTYQINTIINNNWVTDIYPSVSSITVSQSLLNDTLDFAVNLIPNVEDISIVGTPYGPPRPGFNLTYNLTIQNKGTITTDSIELITMLDTIIQIDSITDNYTLIGDSIYWAIDSLEFGEIKSINLFLNIPANVSLLGHIINSEAFIDISNDSINSNNSDTISQVIVGAYDPNDKKVIPQGKGEYGHIPIETSKFDYTIRFQNTGTDTAFNIIVIDSISPLLDLTTFEMLSTSHSYSVEIDDSGVLIWKFNNILLPDKIINEPASHGFIRYSISKTDTIAYGDTIYNKAEIYFDFNPPIVTNTTILTPFDCKSIYEDGPIVNHENLCFGDTLKVIVASLDTNYQYTWHSNKGDTVLGPYYQWQGESSGPHTLDLFSTYAFCTIDTTLYIHFYPEVNVSIDSFLTNNICLTDPEITLNAFPSGGTFSVSGVTSDTFNPYIQELGNSTILYEYIDDNNCLGIDQLTVSVTECQKDEFISVYPNPAINNLVLDTSMKNLEFKIYNSQGKEVFKGIADDNNINISNLSSGTYLLTSDALLFKPIIFIVQ